MFERIIVGFDNSPGSRTALCVAAIVGGEDAVIRVVHVMPEPTTESDEDGVEAHRVVLRAARSVLGDRSRTTFEGVVGITVSSALRHVAALSHAELLVVGGPDVADTSDALRASTTEASLREAPFAVLVCAGREPTAIDAISVLFEDTKEGWHAIRQAGQLAKTLGAELTVLDRVGSSGPLASRAAVAHRMERERQVLHTVGVMVSNVPVVHERLVDGDSSSGVADLVGGADLLATPAHPSAETLRLLLSRDPSRRTRCPLLVLQAE